MQRMDFQFERLMEGELQRDERVVWSGVPSPSRMAKKSWPMVLFGIPWTAFAVFWVAGASDFRIPDFSSPTVFFPMFGLPFVGIGIFLLSSPYWAARKARKSAYYVTDRRALLIESTGFKGVKIRSFYPQDLGMLERNQRPDGSGDIILAKDHHNRGQDTRVTEIGFFGVPDVKSVEAHLAALAQKRG